MSRADIESGDRLPLQRLLKRQDAEVILKDFEALMPGSELAIVRADGRLFVGQGTWPQAELANLLSQASDEHVVQTTDFVLYPLLVTSQLVGGVVGRGPISHNLLDVLQRTLTMLLTHALEKRDIARETLERYREINLLYHVGETIGACLNPQEIPHLFLAEINRVVQSEVNAVLLAEAGDEDELVIRASSGQASHIEALHRASQHLLEEVYKTGRSDIISDSVDSEPLGPILYAPLKSQERILGVALLGRLKRQPMFTAGDKKLVMALVSQTAIALEKAWLHQQEIKRQRLEEELAIGRQIQLSLLPASCPSIPGWEFAASYQAAQQVGGDFYDFFELPDESHRVGLVIADVTGKGVPAALFMAVTRTIIRAESTTGVNPAVVLKHANRLIIQDNRSQVFLSVFYATLDTGSGQLIFANGGHNWPLWLRETTGECQMLRARGVILGAFPAIELEEDKIDIAPGDLLIFYTDGVTDARDTTGQLFGENRLRATIADHPHASAEEMVQAIFSTLKTFAGDTPQSDDITLFVVKRRK